MRLSRWTTMSKVAFDNLQIDQIDDLYDIGETESADAVRRQYSRQKIERTDDYLGVTSESALELKARIGGNVGDVLTTTQDKVEQQGEDISAHADKITQLESSAGGSLAAINESFSTGVSPDGLHAMYTLRVQGTDPSGNVMIGGFGLGTDGEETN